jgi:hypothetical protein
MLGPMHSLRVGDWVIRRHRLLKTRGRVVRVPVERSRGIQHVWVRWDHPHTLPNPSLEASDTLEGVEEPTDRAAGS